MEEIHELHKCNIWPTELSDTNIYVMPQNRKSCTMSSQHIVSLYRELNLVFRIFALNLNQLR